MDRLRTPQKEGEPACALCRLACQSVARGMRTLFAEFVNDPKVREGWRRSGGFCTEHALLAATLGDALGVAILYADLARLARERLEASERRPAGFWRLDFRHRFGSYFGLKGSKPYLHVFQARCMACVLEAEAGTRYAAALGAGLSSEVEGTPDGEVWEALEAGERLCLSHLHQTLTSASPTAAHHLRHQEIARLAVLEAELEEIVRKNDYRFRGEVWGAERDAWLRALDKLRHN